MKIDTSKIPNFDNLPDDVKNAIVAMEFADVPDMSQFVAKSVFDKKASEAADLGRQLKARMSEEELSKAKAAEDMATVMAELEELRTEKAVSEYTTQFMSIGYDEKLAKSTAAALQRGEMTVLFANHAKFVAEREKALKAELLRDTPTPPAGDGNKGVSKEDFRKMTLSEKTKFAAENPEKYKEFYGGN